MESYEALSEELAEQRFGLSDCSVTQLSISQDVPFVHGSVAGEDVVFLLSSNTTQLAWDNDFVEERGWSPVARGTGAEGENVDLFDASSVEVFGRRLKGQAPTRPMSLPISHRLSLPFAGHIGFIDQPKAVALDLKKGLLAMSWSTAARVPRHVARTILPLVSEAKLYETIVTGIGYGDVDPPLPMRMRVSVSNPRTMLSRAWLSSARFPRFEDYATRFMAGLSLRSGAPTFRWTALVGTQQRPHRLLSHVVEESVLSPSYLAEHIDGLVGTDVLSEYSTCVFNYGVGEVWLLRSP